MKKIFILLLSLGTLTSVFAQSGNGRYGDMAMNRGNGYDNRDHHGNDNGYGNNGYGSNGYDNGRHDQNMRDDRHNTAPYGGYGNNGGYRNDRQNNDWQRQQQMDRDNRDYNSHNDMYRPGRTINVYENNRRFDQPQRGRDGKVKSFAGGLIVGGVLGVLLGH